jgi:uncharacterized membrane protein (UPF0127 family)
MRSKAVASSARAGLTGAALGMAALLGATEALAQAPVTPPGPPSSLPPSSLPPSSLRPLEPVDIVTRHGVRRFKVEVADNEASREYGLMYRKSLAPDRGMLFEFDRPDIQSFWMKNNLIPLDILYIAADGKIISIAADARPQDRTPLSSRGPALGVLEIQGGLAAKLGIRPGDAVRHPFFHAR